MSFRTGLGFALVATIAALSFVFDGLSSRVVVWARAQTAGSTGSIVSTSGPDPREIPVPAIKTAMKPLPGVTKLPVRTAMPDVLIMNDGKKVMNKAQWTRRREEMQHILEYYAVGQAPPPPGNVKGSEIKSQVVKGPGQGVRYRLVHLTFGPNDSLSLDIGIFTPVTGGPFPAVIMPGGTPPDATPLSRLPQGPGQGTGVDALLKVGPAESPVTQPTAQPNRPAAGPAAAGA